MIAKRCAEYYDSTRRAQARFKLLKKELVIRLRSRFLKSVGQAAEACGPVIQQMRDAKRMEVAVRRWRHLLRVKIAAEEARRRKREKQRKLRLEKQKVLFSEVLKAQREKSRIQDYRKGLMKLFLKRWQRRVRELEQLQERRLQQENFDVFQRCLAHY